MKTNERLQMLVAMLFLALLGCEGQLPDKTASSTDQKEPEEAFVLTDTLRYCFFRVEETAQTPSNDQIQILSELERMYEATEILLPPLQREDVIWIGQGCDGGALMIFQESYRVEEISYREYLTEYRRAYSYMQQ